MDRRPPGDDGHGLVTDRQGAESAAANWEFALEQARLRGEPSMSRTEAVRLANQYLHDEKVPYVADSQTALPNGLQNLWIVSYLDPRQPNVVLDGGGLVVTAAGEVRDLSSAPGQPEMIGVTFPPGDEEDWMLPNDWDEALGDAMPTPRWSELIEFVDQQRGLGKVYPPADQVFRAFELTPYSEVRVVILGQDPYHAEGQAHGLAFSVAAGKAPPSLRNIFKELERDPKVSSPATGNLEGWADQGVLLLNTVLTVGAGTAHSHRNRGWEEFTDAVIGALNGKAERVVFLLWGSEAQKKARLITNENHTVITAAHPAARTNAHKPLIGSGVFSDANEALAQAGRRKID